jgi:hypothetical protein
MTETALAQSLTWKPVGNGWQLFAGKRRFGRVIPDEKYPGMWRTPLAGGRLSDMANLSWARNAVMEAAIREIAFEEMRQGNTPSKSQQIGGGFGGNRPGAIYPGKMTGRLPSDSKFNQRSTR